MNPRTSHSSLHRRLVFTGICLLVLAVLGFLTSALAGASHGLKVWLLPFAPWSCALIIFLASRQSKDGETTMSLPWARPA